MVNKTETYFVWGNVVSDTYTYNKHERMILRESEIHKSDLLHKEVVLEYNEKDVIGHVIGYYIENGCLQITIRYNPRGLIYVREHNYHYDFDPIYKVDILRYSIAIRPCLECTIPSNKEEEPIRKIKYFGVTHRPKDV